MTPNDREAFAVVMTYLAEAFGERLTPARIATYYEACSWHDVGHLREAAKRAVKTLRFFPKPSELMELASYARAQHRRALAEQTAMALPPPKAAADDDVCTDIGCGKTVADHRAEFRALVERINTPETMAKLSARPSILELKGIHPMRPKAIQWLAEHPEAGA